MASTAMVCLAVLGAALQNVEKPRTDLVNETEVEHHANLLSLNSAGEYYPHHRRRYEDPRDYEIYDSDYGHDNPGFDRHEEEDLYDGYPSRYSLQSEYGTHRDRHREAEIQQRKIDDLKEKVVEEHEVARQALKKAHASEMQRLEALKDERESVERVVKLEKLVKKEKALNKALKEAVVREKRMDKRMADELREEKVEVKRLEGEVDALKAAAAKHAEPATVSETKKPSPLTSNATDNLDYSEIILGSTANSKHPAASAAAAAADNAATDQEIEKINSEIAALKSDAKREQQQQQQQRQDQVQKLQRIPTIFDPRLSPRVEAANITLASNGDAAPLDGARTPTYWYSSKMTILYVVLGIAAGSCLVGTLSSCLYMSATKKRIYAPGFGGK